MIFIVGVGRSGTSLLQSMLNAHSGISFLPETGFLRRYHYSNKFKSHFHFQNKLKRDDRYGRINFFPQDETLMPLDFYKNLVHLFKKTGAAFTGDKDPRLLDFIKELNDEFEKPYIFWIRRDPRDVILSRMRANWSKGYPFLLQVLVCEAQMRMAQKTVDTSKIENLSIVYYENLIQEPEVVLKELCNCLGISFEGSMLTFHKNSDFLVSPSELQWKSKLFSQIDSNNSRKYLKELSALQIGLIQEISSQTMRKNGYMKEKLSLPFFHQCLIYIAKYLSVGFNKAYYFRNAIFSFK